MTLPCKMKHLTTLPAHMCAAIVTSISPSEPAEQTHKKPSNYIFCSNLSRWSRVIYFPLNRPSAFTIKKKKKRREKGKGEKAEGIVIHPRVQRPGRQFLSLTGRFISRSRVNSNVTQDIIDERWRAEVTCLSRTRSVRIVSRIRYHFHGSSWASPGTERFHSGIQYSSCAPPSGMSRLARWTSRKTRRYVDEERWKTSRDGKRKNAGEIPQHRAKSIHRSVVWKLLRWRLIWKIRIFRMNSLPISFDLTGEICTLAELFLGYTIMPYLAFLIRWRCEEDIICK